MISLKDLDDLKIDLKGKVSPDGWGTTAPPGVLPEKKKSGWSGFFRESKKYVGYNTRKDKIVFWKGLPRAAIVFYWMMFRYYVTHIVLMWRGNKPWEAHKPK